VFFNWKVSKRNILGDTREHPKCKNEIQQQHKEESQISINSRAVTITV
jgi:hypothetical protein